MLQKLKEIYNINLDFNKILEDSKGILARPHIAKAIIDEGYPYTWNDIFNNLIGDNCPAYVPNKILPTEEGINLLKKSGALVVLAHPVLIKKIEIKELMKLDFDGIEAVYYINSKNDTRKFKSIASKYNKIITGGSDFHGIDTSDNKHAPKLGTIHLDEDNIKKFLKNLK
ncbi:hypothetical protein [Clostridium oceanicum]|uniref:PHP domain protein n=1 Tax=Clostridium oceanicum TaxID=1543 RepID=A0ABN1JT37_9CLOT